MRFNKVQMVHIKYCAIRELLFSSEERNRTLPYPQIPGSENKICKGGKKWGANLLRHSFYMKAFWLGRSEQRAESPPDNLTIVASNEVAALYLCNNNILITALYGLLAIRVVCQRLCKQTQIGNLVCIK